MSCGLPSREEVRTWDLNQVQDFLAQVKTEDFKVGMTQRKRSLFLLQWLMPRPHLPSGLIASYAHTLKAIYVATANLL